MPGEGAALAAVTFDYWNTLCCEPPGGYLRGRRLEAMSQVLVDAGVGSAGVLSVGGHPRTPVAVLKDGYDAAWLRWNDAWQANRQFTGVDAANSIADWLEREFAGAAAVAGLRPRILEAFAGQGEGAELRLLDGVADALAALSERGIRLGIICDVGFTPSPALLGHLERHGLLEYFDHWSFSDEVGVYKPDPRIFEHALDGLGGPDPRPLRPRRGPPPDRRGRRPGPRDAGRADHVRLRGRLRPGAARRRRHLVLRRAAPRARSGSVDAW